MTDVHVLDVLLYGNPIGTLTRVGDDRALFACNDSYIEDNEAALKFSRTKRFDRYSENELSHLAAKVLLPEKLVLDTARETVALLYRHWNAEKANPPLPGNAVKAIEGHLKIIPLAI